MILTQGVLLAAKTTTGSGVTSGPARSGRKSFQAAVTGTGAVTATVKIWVSNNVDLLGWLLLGTITLSGTTTATDGFTSEGSWLYYKAEVTAITGTGAAVDVIAAQE